MKFDKLAKKAKKELTRNWKKSAALGGCCVVALWFWAPLVAKWMGHDKPPAAPAASPSSTAAVPAAGQPAGTAETLAAKASTLKWDEIVALMKRDPRATTASLAFDRDPFARVIPPPVEADEQEKETQTKAAEAVDMTPQSAGLVLTSTMVSPSGGAATISGRAYSLGELIALESKADAATPAAGAPSAPEFKLLEIHVHHVVLERGKTRYELAMKESQVAKGNRIIVRHGTAENK